MFCLKCGSVIPEGSLYCTKCGLKAGEAPAAPVQPQYVPPQSPPVPQPQPQYVPQAPQYIPPQPTPQPIPVQPQPQYAPPQPQPASVPQPQYSPTAPPPRYVQPQYAPNLSNQGPKARGRVLLLITSILLALIALAGMIFEIIYSVSGEWLGAFPSPNFLAGLELIPIIANANLIWTISLFLSGVIMLGISIAGMPLAFSKKSGGFFIVTGIIFAVGQLITFLAPLISNEKFYGVPFEESLQLVFTPINIILSIIDIGLPVLYIIGGILNKKTR